MMIEESIKNRIIQLEKMGELDPNCLTCKTLFYPSYENGNFNVFAPNHKPSNRCESGKRSHCTCDTCF